MLKSPAMFAALGLLLAAGAGMPAKAQETADGLGQYEIIRNGMGILKYCQSSGHITAGMANEALAIYQSALDPVTSSLTPEQKAAGDAAEKHGREGLAGGPKAPDFAEHARLMRTTPVALCQDTHRRIVTREGLPRQEAYEHARNQIGLMHYCRDKGHIPPARAEEAIGSFQRLLPQLLPGQNPEAAASGDAAEKDGVAGKWGPPPRMDIKGLAPMMSAASMCQTLSSGIDRKAK
jgi:hypothetical protein